MDTADAFERFCVNGVKPWNSVFRFDDVLQDESHCSDTQEQIEQCMNCPHPACINCYDTHKRPRHDKAELYRLLVAGKNHETIKRVLKVGQRTIDLALEDIGVISYG